MSQGFFCFIFFFFSTTAISQEIQILAVDEPPANFLNGKGEADGYVTDIISALQTELGLSIPIDFVPEARGLNILSKNANVILFSLSRTPFREDKFRWVGKVMLKEWQVYARANSDLTIHTLEDLHNVPVIGLVRGDIREEWLINRKFTNLDSVTQHQQNIQRLLLDRVSAIAYEQQGLTYHCHRLNIDINEFKSIFTLNEAAVYIVMSPSTSDQVFNEWQSAYERLLSDGSIERISFSWQKKLKNEMNIHSQIKNNILVF